jgi:ribosome-binding factor A
MKRTRNNEPSQRQLRVGEEIRHVLAEIFMRGDFYAEELSGISVTVTEVDVAPDMRNATAYVSPLGGAMKEVELAEILNGYAPEFNQMLAKKLIMKFTPRLTFSADNRFDYADKIEALLKKTKRDE